MLTAWLLTNWICLQASPRKIPATIHWAAALNGLRPPLGAFLSAFARSLMTLFTFSDSEFSDNGGRVVPFRGLAAMENRNTLGSCGFFRPRFPV
jgi:hypothetical protein